MPGNFLGYNQWGEAVWETNGQRWLFAFNGPVNEIPQDPMRWLRNLDIKTAALAWTQHDQPKEFLALLPQPANDLRWGKPLWAAAAQHLQNRHLPTWPPEVALPDGAPDPYLRNLKLTIIKSDDNSPHAWEGTDWRGDNVKLAPDLFTEWLTKTKASNTRDLWEAKENLHEQIYQGLANHKPSKSWVSPTLAAPQQQALAKWSEKNGDINVWVENNLKGLADKLSPEQIDAIILAWDRLQNKKAFILGDATGKGKGRVLASLAFLAQQHNLNVCFFTEKKHLFQDFYRDWTDLALTEPNFYLLHQEGRIKNSKGKTLYTGHAAGAGAESFIMTTYSQLSHSATAKQKKEWIKSHLNGDYGHGILLLDEAHTAAGKSEIKKQTSDLMKNSHGQLFSTATFAKELQQLSFYKGVVNLPSDLEELLKNIKSHPDLQAALTASLANEGSFIRREHAADYQSQLWLQELSDSEKVILDDFVASWNSLFTLLQTFPRGSVEKHYWYHLGAWVSRSASELALYLKFSKLDKLLDAITAKGAKPVLVLETTLEAGLRRWLEPADAAADEEIEDDGDVDLTEPATATTKKTKEKADKKTAPKISLPLELDAPPLWRERLLWLAKKWWPAELSDEKHFALNACYEALERKVERLPDWQMGVIDFAKEQLQKYYGKNKVGEISGRNLQVTGQKNNWKISSYSNEERTKCVSRFNSGEYEALILTRPGAAGISLHAGEKFKDQRPRVLVEMEVPKNPIERLQFWGRVNRNDQVIDSEIWSWVLDLPSERRRWEKQQHKYISTQAHLGKQTEDNSDLLTPAGNHFVYAWLAQRPEIIKWLGLQARWDDPGETDLLDKFLNRLLVLDLETQKMLIETLTNIADHERDWQQQNTWLANAKAVRCRSQRWMGEGFIDTPTTSIKNHGLWLSEWVVESPMKHQIQDWNVLHSSALANQNDELDQPDWPDEWNQYWNVVKPGMVVKAERPLDHQKAPAFVVERKILSRDPDLPQTAYVKLWWAGMPEATWVSLQRLTEDQYFDGNVVWKSKWWEMSGQGPLRIQILEGNPLMMHWWGQQANKGRSMLWNPQGVSKCVWLLPQYGWDWWMQQSIPLWSYQIAMTFARQNADHALHSLDGKLTLQRENKFDGNWLLKMPKRYYWEDLAYAVRQKLAKPKNSGDFAISSIPSKDIAFIMWGLQNHQYISWCIPREKASWLETYLIKLSEPDY